ncbi:uncharacterized protein FIBRA_04710 [Fibroporia radiculosa]|uniref:ATP-dependent DNA ligase family profile domain-containing protein n=1 Tax=Fibroporia radiculosa TaxID=599839 RepID=J4HWP2_9APHY|nr:uncharacterized protein FIBRA_04710 [Fibroporia radiculosa]CCM02607.1 predicted protein [Fibroporia radiculosa]
MPTGQASADSQRPASVPFAFFVSLIREISSETPRKAGFRATKNRTSYVIRTFRNWVSELHRQYAPLPVGMTGVLFRLLFPDQDVRRKYGLQETTLSRQLAEVFAVSTRLDGRGHNLIAWKDEATAGCLGMEVQKVLSEITPDAQDMEGTLSMVEVDNLLTELALTCAFSGPSVQNFIARAAPSRSKFSILRALYTRLSPVEASIITQIILKDLKPLLYPLPPGIKHYTALLRDYNTNAVNALSLFDAMITWDPSGRMSSAYRVRACPDEAASVYEAMVVEEGPGPSMLGPQVGIPVQIPKCVKGQSCVHSLQALHNSKKVWAETKYDGERAQIHVKMVSGDPHITIFSKSGRDSTLDRVAIHPVILGALKLGSSASPMKKNVILEAEMVAFSDPIGAIDEFWRIRSLIASTAIGPRHTRSTRAGVGDEQDTRENESQCSLISNASDGGTRHLALVFFDILMLDDESLLQSTYSARRKVLESVIQITPGHAMLSERTAIDLVSPSRCAGDGDAQLRSIFARVIADRQEGLVLKADEGKYNERRFPWVKLKKDYIPGYGDCVDLVLLGASWEKDRARELRVSPNAFTTFYIGALSNSEEIKPRCLPHFQIFFTVCYGLSREALESLNFLIKSSDTVKCGPGIPLTGLSYTYNLFSGLKLPATMLTMPLLVEVFGGGFTKAPQCKFYELRFPRISKFYRATERSWRDGTTLPEFQEIAREAIGRERSNKDVEDWCNTLWGRPSSPGVRCPTKRKHTEELWVERLEVVDEKENARLTKKSRLSNRTNAKTWEIKKTDQNSASLAMASLEPPRQLRAFGSVTNTASSSSASRSNHERIPSLRTRSTRPSDAAMQPAGTSGRGLPPQVSTDKPTTFVDEPVSLNHSNVLIVNDHRDIGGQNDSAYLPCTPNVGLPSPPFQSVRAEPVSSPQTAPAYSSTPLASFLQDAAVWLARPQNSPRPQWRAASQSVIPAGQQVHSLESFLWACGWPTSSDAESPGCEWAYKGVVFVDDSLPGGEGKSWMEFPLKTLLERRSAILKMETPRCKPVWVLSMTMLSHEELQKAAGDIEGRAICRLG